VKILHFQVPMDKDKYISPDVIGKFVKLIKEKIGDEYFVLSTPCVPTLLDSENTLLNFDMKQISINELMDLVKAEI
jgi:hypothetical protein